MAIIILVFFPMILLMEKPEIPSSGLRQNPELGISGLCNSGKLPRHLRYLREDAAIPSSGPKAESIGPYGPIKLGDFFVFLVFVVLFLGFSGV